MVSINVRDIHNVLVIELKLANRYAPLSICFYWWLPHNLY